MTNDIKITPEFIAQMRDVDRVPGGVDIQEEQIYAMLDWIEAARGEFKYLSRNRIHIDSLNEAKTKTRITALLNGEIPK
jgi:hypothetical protein